MYMVMERKIASLDALMLRKEDATIMTTVCRNPGHTDNHQKYRFITNKIFLLNIYIFITQITRL